MLPILLAALESEEDKRLFARFYQAHHKKLYRFALSLLHSPALAEEAAQEAWMKCVQNAEQFCSFPAAAGTAGPAPGRGLGHRRPGPRRPPGNCGDHPVHAGAVPNHPGAEICPGVEGQRHRPLCGPVRERREHPHRPGPEAPPGSFEKGGICL